MPRTAAESQGAVLKTILNTMASKKDSYKEGVTQNHQLCRVFADRLTTGDGLEQQLIELNNGSSEDEEPLIPEEDLKAFFKEQEARLKALAENNAGRERKIDAFAGGIQKLQGKVSNDVNGELYAEGTDYEEIIQNLIKEETRRIETQREDLKDSEICKEIREALGEKDASANQGGDDDDIEVVRNERDNENKCKCPMTGTWMEDPVKSKSCGHTFSRAGIMAHIQTCKGKKECLCPHPGCNQRITQQGLESDVGMASLVKRMKRRKEKEEEQRKQSQIMDMEEEEEELD